VEIRKCGRKAAEVSRRNSAVSSTIKTLVGAIMERVVGAFNRAMLHCVDFLSTSLRGKWKGYTMNSFAFQRSAARTTPLSPSVFFRNPKKHACDGRRIGMKSADSSLPQSKCLISPKPNP
jgi:hypothetical protein